MTFPWRRTHRWWAWTHHWVKWWQLPQRKSISTQQRNRVFWVLGHLKKLNGFRLQVMFHIGKYTCIFSSCGFDMKSQSESLPSHSDFKHVFSPSNSDLFLRNLWATWKRWALKQSHLWVSDSKLAFSTRKNFESMFEFVNYKAFLMTSQLYFGTLFTSSLMCLKAGNKMIWRMSKTTLSSLLRRLISKGSLKATGVIEGQNG